MACGWPGAHVRRRRPGAVFRARHLRWPGGSL